MSMEGSRSEFEAVKRLFLQAEELAAYEDDALYRDFQGCKAAFDAEPIDYFKYRFYDLPERERAKYLTRARYERLCREVNDVRACEVFADKALFAESFACYCQRKSCPASPGRLRSFRSLCANREFVVVKPRKGGYGSRVRLESTCDVPSLWATCRREGSMIEEIIYQHEALEILHPGSVNCVRVVTASTGEGRPIVVSAVLRAGTGSSFTDGGKGVFAPLDIETGIVAGSAIDHFLNRCSVHPDTGVRFEGFSAPFWDRLMSRVEALVATAEGVRLANWDWACRDDGEWVLVEGNMGGGLGPCQLALGRGLAEETLSALGGIGGGRA